MQSVASTLLSAPPTWYPGHMRSFMNKLPALLRRTDVVLELRDARLPLTSINGYLEAAVRQWRHERMKLAEAFSSENRFSLAPSGPSLRDHSSLVCEHVIVMNKRDLVPEWGIQPYRKAMQARFPHQRTIFTSWNRPKDVKSLHELLVNIALANSHVSNELNVLVIGMPNVGKSTLLNALRHMGIPGRTAKALRTSASPGLTRALSTRLKLSQDPLVYSYDSPGVMLPFLGKGELGAERALKLALIAGLRESLYSMETLAQYLIIRLNQLNPTEPAYLKVFQAGASPTSDLNIFLDLLARRLGMLKRGGERDTERAAGWFVRWWREEGCSLSASAPFWAASTRVANSAMATESDARGSFLARDQGANSVSSKASATADAIEKQQQQLLRGGWGFDFGWQLSESDMEEDTEKIVQREMERTIGAYLERLAEEEREGSFLSNTQVKKREKMERVAKQQKKHRESQREKSKKGYVSVTQK